jgi:Xaa-Pro aminopeptidase
MASRHIAALLITHLPDVRYLTGFTGSNAVLALASGQSVLVTDGRYATQVKEQARSVKAHITKKTARIEAILWLAEQGVTRVSFDAMHTSVADLEAGRLALPARLRKSFFEPLTEPLIANLRLVKEPAELEAITEAALLGCRLFDLVLPKIRAGVAEASIAAELEYAARNNGAGGMSFETIVAGGERSALPHGVASRALLPRSGFVVLDYGVILGGYCSDMTRTVFLGRPSRQERQVYEAVLEAQQAAVAVVRPGVSCGEVDEAARSVLRKAGLDGFFTHSTGHGVGLEIHEAPRVAAGQTTKLVPGMVITIEPGIYMEGKFGIRIEDMVAVTKTGGQVLTPAPKTLIEL